jgi:hypothetical protein
MAKKQKDHETQTQLAKNIVDLATGEVEEIKKETKDEIKPAAA